MISVDCIACWMLRHGGQIDTARRPFRDGPDNFQELLFDHESTGFPIRAPCPEFFFDHDSYDLHIFPVIANF